MVVIRRYSLALLLLSFVFSSPATLAASVEEEQAELDSLQRTLNKQQTKLQGLQADLDTYPGKIAEAENELTSAEQTRLEETQELKRLQAASGDNAREIRLQEHAVRMAERRVDSQTRSLERVRRYRDELKEDIEKTRSTIARLRRQIESQEQQVSWAREKARQEEQQAATRPPKPPKVEPAPTSRPQQSQQAAERPEPEPQPAQKAAPEKPTLSEADYEALQLAKKIMATIEAIEEPVTDSPRSKTLSGSEIADTELQYLGGDIYRGETTVVQGEQTLYVGSSRFSVDIPEADDGELYVFVADTSNRRYLKLSYFKKSLLKYLDTEVTRAAETKNNAAEKPTQAEEEERVTVTLDSGKTIELSEEDAYRLDLAREQTNLIAELLAEKGSTEPTFSQLTLSGSDMPEKVNFRHIIDDQYRAEATVRSGRQTIRVDTRTFRVKIPHADDGETYVFFVDARDKDRFKLTFFKKSLLQHL